MRMIPAGRSWGLDQKPRLHDSSQPHQCLRNQCRGWQRQAGLWTRARAVSGNWQDGEALWRDPGIRDYYAAPLVDVLDAFWKSKVVQASFIWAWQMTCFWCRPGSEYGRHFTESHGVDRIYSRTDATGGDAPWGVIDGWRRKKPEFWHIKKLYSPILVTTTKLEIPSPSMLQIRSPIAISLPIFQNSQCSGR